MQGHIPIRRLGAAHDGRLSRSRYSRLHWVVTVGSFTAKSGLIYYLAKLSLDIISTGETAMGGWVGKALCSHRLFSSLA